jgi:rubrerythrin
MDTISNDSKLKCPVCGSINQLIDGIMQCPRCNAQFNITIEEKKKDEKNK